MKTILPSILVALAFSSASTRAWWIRSLAALCGLASVAGAGTVLDFSTTDEGFTNLNENGMVSHVSNVGGGALRLTNPPGRHGRASRTFTKTGDEDPKFHAFANELAAAGVNGGTLEFDLILRRDQAASGRTGSFGGVQYKLAINQTAPSGSAWVKTTFLQLPASAYPPAQGVTTYPVRVPLLPWGEGTDGIRVAPGSTWFTLRFGSNFSGASGVEWHIDNLRVTGRMDRIPLHDQELFLSGSNVAWIQFARDIGPGLTRLDQFDQIFQELRAAGGNSMRLWLHTNGRHTPEWNGHDVVGPGVGAIEDLRNILDVAYRNNVTLMLCLWSFDMLRISLGPDITDRNFAILTEPDKRQRYLENALVPMVEALRGHPAILAWEIFNEPEGMSHEFGWPMNRRVPMSDIQAFVGHAAAAIKQADPTAKVTNGAWNFRSLTDILDGTHNMNYYRDDRLREASGQHDGTLDFYTVHYYTSAGKDLSPFHHNANHWQLDKPVVVAEFHAHEDIFDVSRFDLYQTLYDRGYAGALGWQWVQHRQDPANRPNMVTNMEALAQDHPGDVLLVYPRIPK